MTFRFRLQSILNLRIAERDQRRARLAEALRAEALIEQKMNDLGRRIEQSRAATQRASRPGQINVDRLLQNSRHEMVLKAQVGQLQQQRRQVVEELQRRREELMEADRLVKMLEKLRDRRAADHSLWESQQEMKQIDEVAQRKY